jgi:hypothetical protein
MYTLERIESIINHCKYLIKVITELLIIGLYEMIYLKNPKKIKNLKNLKKIKTGRNHENKIR